MGGKGGLSTQCTADPCAHKTPKPPQTDMAKRSTDVDPHLRPGN